MRGYESARKMRLAEESGQREQAQIAMRIQAAAADMQEKKAQAIARANEAAQMGDVQSMQSMAQLAKSGSLDPDQSMLETLIQMGPSLTSASARSIHQSAVRNLMGAIKSKKERGAATSAIKKASEDGYGDEARLMQRLDSGESPQALVQELQKADMQRNVEAMALSKNAESLDKARALISSFPPGQERLMAEYRLTAFENSPSEQKRPDSGARLLEEIQGSLLEGKMAQAKVTAGRMGTAGNRRPPDMAEYSAGITAEKERRYPGSTSRTPKAGAAAPQVDVSAAAVEAAQKARNETELHSMLRERGVKLTQGNIDIAKKAIMDWRASLAPK